MPWLINAAQLDKFRKSQKSLIIFDASLHQDHRDAKQEFIDKHIVGAKFFNINEFKDSHSEIPNKLINDEKVISDKLSALGIRNDYKLIFYDNSDHHSACFALWMMKYFGHNPHQLYILDGGLTAFERSAGKTETGETNNSPKQYTAKFQTQFIRTISQMKENLHTTHLEQVVDLRHPIRFTGGPESLPQVRVGHIPGSISFPYLSFFDANGYFLPLDKLKTRFASVTIDLNVPIVATSGAGLSAAILDFVLDLMDHKQHSLYLGSWAEWGSLNLLVGENDLTERPVENSID